MGKKVIAYTKPVRRRIKRNSVIVKEINQQWDVDLMDMTRIASDNDFNLSFSASIFFLITYGPIH